MKTIKLFIAVLILASFTRASFAQDKSMGLYLTFNDYMNHRLSFETDGTSGNAIRLNSLLETGNIVVWHDGKKQVLLKAEVFGYHANNEDYRFFNNTAYKIVDTKDFYIYSRTKLSQQGKGLKPMDAYYFSARPNTLIEPLTVHNLELAYNKNLQFKYIIEGQFKADNDLIAYDTSIKEYKLKYLFEQAAAGK